MQIRRLTFPEHTEANLISAVAFHIRIPDITARRAEWAQGESSYKNDDWGAFSEDGELMAHAINSTATSNLFEKSIKNSCVGAVSTLPEFRNTGAVRAIFREMLSASRDEGALISTLYPFNHAFYRKFGYETVCYANEYELSPAALKGFSHSGWVKMWHPGEAIDYFKAVYDKFALRYNLAFVRDEKQISNHIRGEYYKDRRFCYLIGDTENGPTAYVVFYDKSESGEDIINVADLAFTSPFGLRCLLGFLARFTADYAKIRIKLPVDIDLRKLVSEPYDIKNTTRCDYMVRVLDVPKALSMLKVPEDKSITISITDDFLPANSGIYIVNGMSVTQTEAPADISLSIQAFSQLFTGAASFDEILYRQDVTLNSNSETLRTVFPGHTCYIADHF